MYVLIAWMSILFNRLRRLFKRPHLERGLPTSPRRSQYEQLETRALMTVTPILFGNELQFQGGPGDSDDLYLRAPGGVLEYSTDAITYSRDMDLNASGIQTFTVRNDTLVKADVGGTVYIGDMTRAAGTFLSLDDMKLKAGATISTRQIAGTDQEHASSIGNSFNITFQAPDLTIDNDVHVWAHTEPGSGYTAGDVQFIADTGYDLTFDGITPFFRDQDATATINVLRATVQAGNINISTVASNLKFAQFDLDAPGLANYYNSLFATLKNPELYRLIFDDNDSGGDTITRENLTGSGGAGSWLQDGFEPGQLISIQGTFSQLGNRLYRIASVIDTVITLTESDVLFDTVIDGTAVIAETIASMQGTTNLTFEKHPLARDKIIRATGSWQQDGFQPGQTIVVDSSAENDDQYVIESVTADVLTLTQGGLLSDDFFDANESFGMSGSPLLSFTAADDHDTITRSSGSFIADGFRTGRSILISHGTSTDNVGSYTIAEVTATTLTLFENNEVVSTTNPVAGFTITSMRPTIAAVFTGLDPAKIPMQAVDRLGHPIQTARLEAEDIVDQLKATAVQVQALESVLGVVQAVLSDVDSTITVGAGARLVASGDVLIRSRAQSEVSMKSPGFDLGPLGAIGTPLAIGFGKSDTEARARVEDGATIVAGDQFQLTSNSINTLNLQMISYSGLLLGSGTYFKKTPKSLDAAPLIGSATSRLRSPLNLPFPTASFSVGLANSESEALLARGANVTAGSAIVASDNTNNFGVQASSKVYFPRKNFGSGLMIAVSQTDSDSLAAVDGTLTTTGDATIESKSINSRNQTIASAVFKDELPGHELIDKTQDLTAKIKDLKQTEDLFAGNQASQFGMAAAVAIAVTTNEAVARIGQEDNSNALQQVTVGGNLRLNAEAEDNFQGTAVGAAKSFAQVSLGGAVNFGTHTNEARAVIGPGAQVDVDGKLDVLSEAEIPNQITLDDQVLDALTAIKNFSFQVPVGQLFSADSPTEVGQNLNEIYADGSQSFNGLLSTFAPLLFTVIKKGDLKGSLATSFTSASANAKAEKSDDPNTNPTEGKFGFAGTVNVMLADNFSEAQIAAAARINQRRRGGNNQSVVVRADSNIESVNLAGLASPTSVFTKLGAGGVKSDGVGIGANVTATIYGNSTRAHIDDDAKVYAGWDVRVESNTHLLNIGMAQAGAAAGVFGFSLTGAGTYFSNDTTAWMEDSVQIEAGRDVQILADTDLTVINFSLAMTKTERIGVGVNAGVNIVDNLTAAFIDNVDGEPAAVQGSIIAGRDFDVDAETDELMITMGLSGAIASEKADEEPPKPSTEFLDGTIEKANTSWVRGSREQAQAASQAKQKARSDGIGNRYRTSAKNVSQSESILGKLKGGINGLRGISGPKISGQREPDLKLYDKFDKLERKFERALNDKINEQTSSLAKTFGATPVSSDEIAKSNGGVGIAGDAAVNVVIDATEALVRNIKIAAGRDIAIIANSDSLLVNNTLSIAAANAVKSAVAVSGSLAGNYVERGTDARSDNAILNAGGDVFVLARAEEEDITITAGGAGAFLARPNSAAIAGSINVHILANAARALMDLGTQVTAGSVFVSADNEIKVRGAAGGVAIGGGLGAGAAIDVLFAANTAKAEVADGVVINARSNVDILAHNDEDFFGLTAMLAAAPQGNALEGSGAAVVLLTESQARVGEATRITAGHNIRVDADDNTRIINSAGGGAGGDNTAIGVSLGADIIFREVSAQVSDDAVLTTTASATFPSNDAYGHGISGRGIIIEATAQEDRFTFAASGAISTNIAIAPSIVAQMGASVVEALVDQATLDSFESVALHASHTTSSISASGSLGISTGTAGVGLAADLQGAGKEVTAAIGDRANIAARKNVTVQAENRDFVLAVSATLAAASEGAGAGAVNVISLFNEVQATIGDATITAGGSVAVEATSLFTAIPVAGALALSLNVGVGVSDSTIVHIDQVSAKIGAGSHVQAAGQQTLDALTGEYSRTQKEFRRTAAVGVLVTAISHQDILSSAVAGALAAEVSVPGAITDAFFSEQAIAEIGGTITALNGPGGLARISALAVNQTKITDVSGSESYSGSVAVGVSGDLVILNKTTEASVLDGSVINSQGDLQIEARSIDDVLSSTFNGTVGGVVGVGGAANVYAVVSNTRAYLGGDSIEVAGDVSVKADANAKYQMSSGAIGVGDGTAGVGGSATLLVHVETVEALIGAGTEVNAAGRVLVDAKSLELLVGQAVAGAGAQYAAVAGSANFAGLAETTTAEIASGAIVHAGGDVRVEARDETQMIATAGALSISISLDGGAGAGAGADVGVVLKNTRAEIGDDAQVSSHQNIFVEATDVADILSIATSLGIGAGLTIGIAGSLGLHALLLNTTARVGAGAILNADGSIIVDTSSDTQVTDSNLNMTAGAAGAGAALGAMIVTNHVNTMIDDSARLTALALLDPVTAVNGQFDVAYGTYSDEIKKLMPSFAPSLLPVSPNLDDVSELAPARLLDPSLTKLRTASPQTQSVRGVAVGAVATTDIKKFAAGGGGGAVAVQLSGSANIIKTDVSAHVANGAIIHAGSNASGNVADILIAAGSDYASLGLTGSLAYGGGAGGGFELSKLDSNVSATTGDVELVATRNIEVVAHQTEDNLSLVASATIGSGLAGSVAGILINNTTTAEIGDDAFAAATNNIVVSASDDSDLDTLAGSLVTNDGIGASLSIYPIDKRTIASIGKRAVINAFGNADATTGFTGTRQGDVFETESVHGLAIQASSTENIFNFVIAGAFTGSTLLVSGAAAVNLVDSDTQAFIGELAIINSNRNGASAEQDVSVAAVNFSKYIDLVGTASVSSQVALAGAVDVGITHNDTSATIGNGAVVDASDDIDVHAGTSSKVLSLAASASLLAQVGVGGAASAWTMGANFDSDAKGSISTNDGNSDSVANNADERLADNSIDQLLAGYSSDDPNGAANDDLNYGQQMGTAIADARRTIGENQPNGRITEKVEATRIAAGTTAMVGNQAVVRAGGTADITAKNNNEVQQTVGVIQANLVSAGGSVVVTTVELPVSAQIGDGAHVTSAEQINLHSSSQQDLAGRGLTGSGAGLVGLGAQVVIVKEAGQVKTNTGVGAKLDSPQVLLGAQTNRDINALSIGGALAGGVAAGVAVGRAEVTGATSTTLGDANQVGKNVHVLNLKLQTDDTTSIDAQAYSVAAGIGIAAQGANAAGEITPSIASSVGKAADLKADNVLIYSFSQQDSNAQALGVSVAAGIGIGASVSESVVSPTVTTSVGEGSHVQSTAFTALARHNTNIPGAPTGSGADSSANASGGGLLVGANGAVANAEASAIVTSQLGPDVQVEASGISVDARSSNRASAVGDSFTGGGLAGVGIVLVDTQANGTTKAEVMDDAKLTSDDALNIRSFATDEADSETTAHVGGALAAGSERKATSQTSPMISSSVGAGAILNSLQGDITVQADSANFGHAAARGVTVAPGLSIGVSISETTVTPQVIAAVGDRSELNANVGKLNIKAASNTDVASAAPIFAGTTRGADAWATSSGGGLIGIGGAFANATDASEVSAVVGEQASLSAAQAVEIFARSSDWARAQGRGNVVAGGGVGGVFADAHVGGHNQVDVGNDTQIAAQDISLDSKSYADAEAGTQASTLGLIFAVNGSDASASNDRVVTAETSRGSELIAGRDINILAATTGRARSTASGLTAGAVAVGGSFADSQNDSVVSANIGNQALLQAGGNLVLNASFDPVVAVVGNTTRDEAAWASASGSAGALLGATGTDSHADANVKVSASVGNLAVLEADSEIDIVAHSHAVAFADGNNKSTAIFTLGTADAHATIDADTRTNIGNQAQLHANKIVILAEAEHDILSRSHGRGDGLVVAFGSEASAIVTYMTLASIGDNAILTAVDSIVVKATTRTDGDLRAAVGEEGADLSGITSARASSTGVIGKAVISDDDWDHITDFNTLTVAGIYNRYAAVTNVEIGNNAQLNAKDVALAAQVLFAKMGHDKYSNTGIFGGDDAMAVVDVHSAIGLASALSKMAVLVNANVIIRSGAEIYGRDKVRLQSETSRVQTFSTTDSDPDGIEVIGGISIGAGGADAVSYNVQLSKAGIQADTGSDITTNQLVVDGTVNPVIWDTRAGAFSDQASSNEETEKHRGRGDVDVNFNSTVTVLRDRPFLTVNSNGSTQSQGIDFTSSANQVQINGIKNDLGTGSVNFNLIGLLLPDEGANNPDFDTFFGNRFQVHDVNLMIGDNKDDLDDFAESVVLNGAPHFDYSRSYESIEIVNNSNKQLVIGDLSIPTATYNAPSDSLNLKKRANRERITKTLHGQQVDFRRNYVNSSGGGIAGGQFPDRNITGSFNTIPGATLQTYVANRAQYTTAVTTSAATSIIVVNTGASDVLLTGTINNPGGQVSIENSGIGGDILSDGSQLVKANAINLKSLQGNVGAANRVDLELNTVSLVARGQVSASAGDDVNLGVRSQNDIELSNAVNLASIRAGDGTDDNLVLTLLDRPTKTTTFYVGDLSAGDDIQVNATTADLTLIGSIKAGDTVRLSTQLGALLDGRAFAQANLPIIVAPNQVLTSAKGIGTSTNRIESDAAWMSATTGIGGVYLGIADDVLLVGLSGNGSPLDVQSSGAILIAGPIQTTGNVKLAATESVTQLPGFQSIAADDLTITAASIGSALRPLTIDVTSLLVDTSTGNGNVYVADANQVILPAGKTSRVGTGTFFTTNGELIVNGTLVGGLTATSGVISGRGVIQGPLQVASTKVAPGATLGVLTAGNTSLAATSTLQADISGPLVTPIVQYDQLRVQGNIDLGSAHLAPNLLYTANPLDTYTLVSASGVVTGLFNENSFRVGSLDFVTLYGTNRVLLMQYQLPTEVTTANSTPLLVRLNGNNTTRRTLSFSVLSGPANGTLTGTSPNFTYRANPGFVGVDTFTYQVNEGGALSLPITFSIRVQNVTVAPTDIGLSSRAVRENVAIGTTVGTLSSVDANASDTFTYALVSGTGSTDNAVFAIVGNQLRTAANLDYEIRNSYSVRIRTTDSAGLSFEKAFAIEVTNATESLGIDVQQGQTQRSFVRYVDLAFDIGSELSTLIAQNRIQLTKLDLDGTRPTNVSLRDAVFSKLGNSLRLDFGVKGIGGTPDSSAADGYYEVSFDFDGDGQFESSRRFYRLLGDVNGDRKVNAVDSTLILQALGTRNPERDANGDGIVNANDRMLAVRSANRKLKDGLPLDD